ncbi:MAG: hypothetical protein IKH31_03065 [Clostridia bacterium]|nr:hypothetical protein [Clostridia bacterium]
MVSLLDLAASKQIWQRFYEYKTSLMCTVRTAKELKSFIDEERYLPILEKIAAGESLPLPKRSVISKMGSKKKRIVYTYPDDFNTVLKLITYLLLRKYDGIFSKGLYSFRPGLAAKDAVMMLKRDPDLGRYYSYKVDISNYFNSIDIPRFLPILRDTLEDDAELYSFLAALLSEPKALDRGNPIEEQKGIMAGTPVASFYANLYLKDLDRHFSESGVLYARYSDDIIVFAETEEETAYHASFIRSYLNEKGLAVNPSKEQFSSPEEGAVFLGFMLKGDTVDIAPASVKKLKQKMRRKARALQRWHKRNGVPPEKAALAFVRVFNRKLFENPSDNELTWTYWFFPVINTDKSLHEIDLYAQECIRSLAADSHTKSRFNFRYEDMKKLGYRSLVHAYYDYSEEERARRSKKRAGETGSK